MQHTVGNKTMFISFVGRLEGKYIRHLRAYGRMILKLVN